MWRQTFSFAKDTTTRDSLPPLTIWKFYLRYCLRKNVNKQKHKILKILRPEVTNKKIPLIFLHFLFKVRPYIFYFKIDWSVFEKKWQKKNNNRKLYTILLQLTSRSSMPFFLKRWYHEISIQFTNYPLDLNERGKPLFLDFMRKVSRHYFVHTPI